MWLSDLTHDVLPDSALTRWSPSFPILAFTDGLLFAFALVEPLVQQEPAVAVSTPDPAESEGEIAHSPRTVSLVGQPDEE